MDHNSGHQACREPELTCSLNWTVKPGAVGNELASVTSKEVVVSVMPSLLLSVATPKAVTAGNTIAAFN